MVLKTDTPAEGPEVAPAGDGAESLADLAREADLLDTSPAREGEAAQAVAVAEATASTEEELRGALELVRGMLFPLLATVTPEAKLIQLGQVWHDGVLLASAKAGAQVMALHGWTMGGVGDLFGRYGPYVSLALALVPPVIATKKIMEAPDPKPDEKAPGQTGEGDGARQQQ
jgi:hypothetical protein